ncbi:mucin-1 [Crotalus adamanteus]|uniref:Mucin-1 n=1 Tax=Crotalus adamanteus TaxID=8729 RepID=A0AAW1ALY7_CROAD
MYNNLYNCSTCQFGYIGYTIISFSEGSVAVESQLIFRGSNIKSESEVEKILSSANTNSTGGLQLSQVKVSSTKPTVATETVPGWGIALLVLVCILVFALLLALLWLLVFYCRRKHRGSMELLSGRDSYHPMNEYPTYQTHGRYAAPNQKQNPYGEVSAGHSPEHQPVNSPPGEFCRLCSWGLGGGCLGAMPSAPRDTGRRVHSHPRGKAQEQLGWTFGKAGGKI